MSARLAPEDRDARIDAALEELIEAARLRMVKPGATDDESREAWDEMAALHARRSPAQVMRMEIEMGLLRKKAAG